MRGVEQQYRLEMDAQAFSRKLYIYTLQLNLQVMVSVVKYGLFNTWENPL